MRTSECNGRGQPAGWRTADGRLWFPTIDGVAVIDQDECTECGTCVELCPQQLEIPEDLKDAHKRLAKEEAKEEAK